MKALLINGSRRVASYGLAVTNGINFQGWGLDNIQNIVPVGGLTSQFNTAGSSFFVDQSPTNALATGDSQTFIVNVDHQWHTRSCIRCGRRWSGRIRPAIPPPPSSW